MKRGRPRKLSQHLERLVIEEVRMGHYFKRKKIAQRAGITEWALNNYVRKARNEGRL